MAGKRTKKQHYVPRFYLDHFKDSEGHIWTYDKKGEDVRFARPEETAIETNFYSVIGEDGEYIDALEDWLAEVESLAAPLYPKVLKGEILTGDDRVAFSLFIASLHVRSPAMVNAVAKSYGEMAQIVTDFALSTRERFEQSMYKMDEENGEITPKDVRDKVFEFQANKDLWKMNVDKRVGLMNIDAAPNLSHIIHDMSWITVEPENQHLITSDNPVVRITPREYIHPIYGDGGFVHKKVFVTLPLSPNRMLEMFWGEQPSKGVRRVDKERGKLYNRQRAGFSERYLYSSRRDAGIRALADKHHEPGLRINIGHPGKRAKVELKRKL